MIWGLLLVVGAVVCGLAWWLTHRAASNERAVGLPLSHAQVVYSDSGAWEKIAYNLKSDTFGLIGKPDYILRTRTGIVPVEVKPLRRATQPYTGDILQLAAYCLLVEEESGSAPLYGLLRYAAHTFKIEWNASLRQELLDTLNEMRDLTAWPAQLGGEMPTPQHDMTVRCAGCGLNYICYAGYYK